MASKTLQIGKVQSVSYDCGCRASIKETDDGDKVSISLCAEHSGILGNTPVSDLAESMLKAQ